MKLLLWVLGLALAAVLLSTLFAGLGQGFVAVVMPTYRAEMSLNTFIFLTVLVLIVGYMSLRAVAIALNIPSVVRHNRDRYQQKKWDTEAVHAVHAYFEGKYNVAEKSLARLIPTETREDYRAALLLMAARSAHAAGLMDKRDVHLAEMSSLSTDWQLARYLTEAEQALDERNTASAAEALQQVLSLAPQSTAAQQLELKVRVRQGEDFLPLLVQLERAKAMPAAQIQQYRQQGLRQQATRLDDTALAAWWKKLPAEVQQERSLLALVFPRLLRAGQVALVWQALVDSLNAAWHPQLVALLADPMWARVPAEGQKKRMQQAETWLLTHRKDAILLRTLASVCVAQQLWGKAESYAEASLAIEPSPEIYHLLATLATHKAQADLAASYYQKGLQLAVQGAGYVQ